MAQQQLQLRRMRELRRAAKAAELTVELARQLRGCLSQGRGRCRQLRGRRRRIQPRHGRAKRAFMAAHACAVFLVMSGDALQYFAETGHPHARCRREVSAGKKRRVTVRRERHGQRPAAGPLGQELMRGLVDFVEVRAFLAVDFDAHKQFVHARGDGFVFKTLALHDMTPVARRVANRQQNRLVLVARLLQRDIAPRLPVHRVVRVLQKIRAGLVAKRVGHRLRPIGWRIW